MNKDTIEGKTWVLFWSSRNEERFHLVGAVVTLTERIENDSTKLD